MLLEQRIAAFNELGHFLETFKTSTEPLAVKLNAEVEQAVHYNGWFTKDTVNFAIAQWHQALNTSNLKQWTSAYSLDNVSSKTVGLITAGNLPLVGFHDVLSVLISGHNIIIKPSSNDKRLLPIILEKLITIEPLFSNRIAFTQDKLTNYDAVIATGSNNTSRYFDYYFRDVPKVIRKNRHSVAVLTGNESKAQLEALADDIFRYFGLGCRNVSKLLVPQDYDFTTFFEALYTWQDIIHINKYANNYDYNKAIYLMSGANMLDNNFLLLKEDDGLGSPIGVLFYESYSSTTSALETIENNKEHIQCVVSNNLAATHVPFGQTQHPELWDYADGVDTLSFLENL